MLVPIEKKAIGIASNRTLYASKNERLWVLERGDPERTIDPDDVEATDTPVDVFADADATDPVSQPLYSDASGSYPYWIDSGSVDYFLPDDPVSPLEPVEAVSGQDVAALLPEFFVDSYRGISANDAAATQNAIAAAEAAGGGVVTLGRGIYNFNVSGASPCLHSHDKAVTVRGQGEGKTLIQLGSHCETAFNLARSADYQTFSHLTWEDFTVDGTGATGNDPIIGTFNGAVNNKRINIEHVRVRRITTQNVDISKANVSFFSSQPGADEATQNLLTDIVVEDCDFGGGFVGAAVTGAANGSYEVNVFFDLVRFENCKHDTGVVPTSGGTGAGFQIGAWGYGDRARMINCHSKNSVDVGFEIDGAQDFVGRNCSATDAFNGGFAVENFHVASDALSQRIVWEQCQQRLVNTSNAVGFAAGGAVNILGHQILKDCSLHTKAAPLTRTAQAVYCQGDRGFYSLTIDGFRVIADAIADTSTGTQQASYFDIYPNQDGALTMRRLQFKLSGSTSNGSANPLPIKLGAASGKTLAVDVDGISYDIAITGLAAQHLYGLVTPISGTVRGRIKGIDVAAWGADSDALVVVINSTASGTLDFLRISECDFSKAPGSTAAIAHAGAADQKAKVFYDRIRPKAGVATTKTIAPSGSPFNYQNLDGYQETVTVKGGTVTKIEISRDGSTYIDTGVTAGAFVLDNAGFLKVTYSSAPTMNAIFRR